MTATDPADMRAAHAALNDDGDYVLIHTNGGLAGFSTTGPITPIIDSLIREGHFGIDSVVALRVTIEFVADRPSGEHSCTYSQCWAVE